MNEEGCDVPGGFVDRLEPEATVSEIVGELAGILGAPLVAVLGEAHSTAVVRDWIDGVSVPDCADRFAFALRVARVILQREEADVVRAWFGGLNPDLGDQNPVLLLVARSSEPDVRSRMLLAARRYATD